MTEIVFLFNRVPIDYRIAIFRLLQQDHSYGKTGYLVGKLHGSVQRH